MYPTPGLHNLVAYCRSAAAGLDERVAARKGGKQPETTANLQAMAATWRDWADDLEKLLARAGGAKGWGE